MALLGRSCAPRMPPQPPRRGVATHHAPSKSASHVHHHHQCWSCKVSPLTFRDAFFCGSCGTVQPQPGEANCFERIGLPVQYNLDLKELDRKFKAMQRKLHPDFFHGKAMKEQELSHELSKSVNRCYRTLRDPNLRGLYMLRLRGFEIKEAERVTDQDFLMKTMELHELLAEKPDTTTLARLRAENDSELRKHYADIDEAFKKDNYTQARDLLIKVQYLERLADEMHRLTPVK